MKRPLPHARQARIVGLDLGLPRAQCDLPPGVENPYRTGALMRTVSRASTPVHIPGRWPQ